MPLWSGGMALWSGDTGTWAESLPTWSGGMNWAGGMPLWSGGMALWSGGMPLWSGGMALWSGGMPLWSGGMAWAGGMALWSGGMALWSGGLPLWSGSTRGAGLGANEWMDDDDAYETGQESERESSAPADTVADTVAEPVVLTEPALEPAPSAPQETPTLHVSDMDNLSYWESSKKWIGAFSVEVSDANGQRLLGAQVTLTVSDMDDRVLATVPCTTNQSGSCLVVTSPQQASKVDQMTVTVQDVALNGYVYTALANSDPDGDSNGTSITAYLPDRSRSSTNIQNIQQSQPGNSVAIANFNVSDSGEGEAALEIATPEQTIRLFLPTLTNSQ